MVVELGVPAKPDAVRVYGGDGPLQPLALQRARDPRIAARTALAALPRVLGAVAVALVDAQGVGLSDEGALRALSIQRRDRLDVGAVGRVQTALHADPVVVSEFAPGAAVHLAK